MVDNNKNKQNNAKQEKTFWKLTRNQWGWVSTITNGLSVLFQLY